MTKRLRNYGSPAIDVVEVVSEAGFQNSEVGFSATHEGFTDDWDETGSY